MDLDVSEHIVMLYYRDIDAAREFYGKALGLKSTLENEWVTLFRVTPRSAIGIIKEGGAGGFHKVQDTNAVMVSIATRDIAGWYQHLKHLDTIEFVKDLYQASTLPMQAFLVRDPGGYTVEFFQWHEQPR